MNAGRKKGRVREKPWSPAGDRHTEILLVSHDLVVMHRLTEMG